MLARSRQVRCAIALDDALHDPLTRLPNRRLFERRLEASNRSGEAKGLFVRDLVCRFGSVQGNQRSVRTSGGRSGAGGGGPSIGRSGCGRRIWWHGADGDEFTILLDDLAHADDAITVARRILEHLRLPLATAPSEGTEGEQKRLEITASIGIALPAGDSEELSVEQLMSRADAAMYRAKGCRGRNLRGLSKRPSMTARANTLRKSRGRSEFGYGTAQGLDATPTRCQTGVLGFLYRNILLSNDRSAHPRPLPAGEGSEKSLTSRA